MEKSLLIVEGPAASGKSTLISKLIKDGHAVTPSLYDDLRVTLERPRDYKKFDDPQLFAMFKDLTYFIAALKLFREENSLVCIDRGFISGIVYQCIRENVHASSDKFIDLIIEMMGRVEEIFDQVDILLSLYDLKHDEFVASMGGNLSEIHGNYWETFQNYEFLVLLPSPTELIRRREKQPHLYPFGVYQESEYYSRIMNFKKEFPELPHLVTTMIDSPIINSLEVKENG